MLKKTMQQKRQSISKNKNEIYPQKSMNVGQKSKSKPKGSNGKIKVVVRKRPINENEKRKKDSDIVTVKDNHTICIDEPRYKVDMTKYIERHEFIVDKVFDETVDNLTVYQYSIKPLIIDIFESNCVCSCFAYGQTGSGKTYTMLGSQPYGQSNCPGIFQYASEDIFNLLNAYNNDNSKGIFISFYEIYCGKLYDLLQKRKMVAALENGKKEVVVKDLKILRVINKEELIQKMIEGVMLRKIGVNSQNDESSRSHAILNIDLKDINKNVSLGKIAFIDLAGSERGADTIAQNKQTQTDGANINRSLLALKECIRAMDSDKNHIPFRDSELTKVLRDIFVGKSKSIMIANISPTISSCEQTLNTLRYSSRVKNFKTKPMPNDGDDTPNDPNSSIHTMSYYKSSELNYSSTENFTMKSNSLMSSKPESKSIELRDKNNEKSNKKMQKNVCDKNVKHSNKNRVNTIKKNNTIPRKNYTFSDTSDFSSLDDMNYSLNNSEKTLFTNSKSVNQPKIKSRNSCDTINSKMKKNDMQVLRHSVGSKLTNFSHEKSISKENEFSKNAVNQSKNILFNGNTVNKVSSINSIGNPNMMGYEINRISSTSRIDNPLNNNDSLMHGNLNINKKVKEASRDSDNMFFDAVSHPTDNKINIYSNNKNYKLGYSNSNSIINDSINNNINDSSISIGIKKRFIKGTSLLTNDGSDNNSIVFQNDELNAGSSSFSNWENNLNCENTNNNNMVDFNIRNINLTEVNMDGIKSNSNNNLNICNNAENMETIQNNQINSNAIRSIELSKNSNYQVIDETNTDNNLLNDEYLKQFQKSGSNNILGNCISSLNIADLYEDTQNILNNVLLSKYKANRDDVIKKYINEDISNMNLEQLDKYVQFIYEKKKTILNKLLFLFKKNVDIQTNNEISDLKKDLVMCHICSNNPDDQFHFYAYSRLEKDIINLIMLRQLWCESENLRQLHQYLMTEYQTKSANSILFNLQPSNANKNFLESPKSIGVDINTNKTLNIKNKVTK
ncbi:kinesin-13, putative [Plasmodium vinckei petteri]|uniref:Kinesin-13, putative n=2 Tax=Plasmodium vinckei petteri TaxID=138298 RepID=A0A6V7TGJ7_PLAVN|nr:kinesin-13, putative [Plasmodium vinckei petteri]